MITPLLLRCRPLLWASAALWATCVMAQQIPDTNSLPDTAGTGPYPAMKEEVASLPHHVVYRPSDLAALGKQKLGVVAWATGVVPRTAPAPVSPCSNWPRMAIW